MLKRVLVAGLSIMMVASVSFCGMNTYVIAEEIPAPVSGSAIEQPPLQTPEAVPIQAGTSKNKKSVSLVPGKVKGLKVKRSHGKFIVTWKKVSGVSGYQVYTKVFVKGIKTKYSKVKTLKGRKYKRGMLVRHMKYGFKVRAYKKVNGKNVYGAFATVTKRY